MKTVRGIIIMSGKGKFLSRSGHWVQHINPDNGKPDPQMAYVHPVEALDDLQAHEAEKVQMAQYDPKMECTVPTGKPVYIEDFVPQ